MTAICNFEEFLSHQTIAIIGASQNKKKFGNIVLRFLEKQGFTVLPVNPHENEIEGKKCYPSVCDLPETVKAAVFITQPCVTEKIISEIISMKNIEHIWIQQGAESSKAITIAEKAGINTIYNECIMMYIRSSGVS